MLKSEIHGSIDIENPIELPVLELKGKILELTGSRGEIIFEFLPKAFPAMRYPHIKWEKELIGWKPHVSLGEGLPNTIDYLENSGPRTDYKDCF